MTGTSLHFRTSAVTHVASRARRRCGHNRAAASGRASDCLGSRRGGPPAAYVSLGVIIATADRRSDASCHCFSTAEIDSSSAAAYPGPYPWLASKRILAPDLRRGLASASANAATAAAVVDFTRWARDLLLGAAGYRAVGRAARRRRHEPAPAQCARLPRGARRRGARPATWGLLSGRVGGRALSADVR
eukprot:2511387-Prymnesium_polylepis.1